MFLREREPVFSSSRHPKVEGTTLIPFDSLGATLDEACITVVRFSFPFSGWEASFGLPKERLPQQSIEHGPLVCHLQVQTGPFSS